MATGTFFRDGPIQPDGAGSHQEPTQKAHHHQHHREENHLPLPAEPGYQQGETDNAAHPPQQKQE